MKYGIQVNVGMRGTPQWRWLHHPTMDRAEWPTREAAEAQKELWYPGSKSAVFRVEEIDETP